MNDLQLLLNKMWNDYIAINPLASKIFYALQNEGEVITNDHIALRTFNHPRVCIDNLAKPFIHAGYREAGEYEFKEKKLFAKHYEHHDSSLPKIFISQLLLEKFSSNFQNTVHQLIDQIPREQEHDFHFSSMGRPWKIKKEVYQNLLSESEYAGWVAAFGYRPNHFTVLVNNLKKYSELPKLNEFLKSKNFQLNSSGGEIKGSKDVYLEQSSTLANNIEVQFDDGALEIPSCYYEFAKRYPLPSGKLYQGFVAKSADKIFESTHKGQ